MGKRMFNDRLLNPLCTSQKILKRYEIIYNDKSQIKI